MYSVDSLKNTIEWLFQDGVGANGYSGPEVKNMLLGIEYDLLLQAVRHKAQTVHAYTTQDEQPKAFNYRGRELFSQRATLLYEDFDQSWAGIAMTTRTYELWLLEDMSLSVVACVSVNCGGGEHISEYREIKTDRPWDSDLCLDLGELSDKLHEMCAACAEYEIPVYEL